MLIFVFKETLLGIIVIIIITIIVTIIIIIVGRDSSVDIATYYG